MTVTGPGDLTPPSLLTFALPEDARKVHENAASQVVQEQMQADRFLTQQAPQQAVQ